MVRDLRFIIITLFPRLSKLFLTIGVRLSSISYPTLFLSFWAGILVVVPEPKKGSRTVSLLTENIRISLFAISSGNVAVRLASWLLIWRVPFRFQIWVNQASRCFFVNLLSWRFASLFGNLRRFPFLKMRMNSQSSVTQAFGGRKPEPRNAPFAFVFGFGRWFLPQDVGQSCEASFFAVFDYSGVVKEEAEFAVDGACGVPYVYACDSTVHKNTIGFLPDFRQAFVHGVLNLRDRFLAIVSLQHIPQLRDFRVHLAELLIPHLYHGVRRRSHSQMNARIG
jgi:hypothetical protein